MKQTAIHTTATLFLISVSSSHGMMNNIRTTARNCSPALLQSVAKRSFTKITPTQQSLWRNCNDGRHSSYIFANLEKGADINYKVGPGPQWPSHHSTPFHKLVLQKWHDLPTIIDRVINKHGANPNSTDSEGNTPVLLAASRTTDPYVIQILAENGGSLTAKNNDGDSVLHVSIMNGINTPVIQCLLAFKADPNAQNNKLETPMHLAVPRPNSIDALQLLLEKGANPNMQDENGDTPLHLAVASRNNNAFQALMDAGADSGIINKEGISPFDLALLMLKQKKAETAQKTDTTTPAS